MIIVKFCSGLGNQLFQYALYYSMKKKYPNQTVLADVSVFADINKLNAGNGFNYGFALNEFFELDIDIANREEIEKVNYEIKLLGWYRKLLTVSLCRMIVGNSIVAKIRAKILPKYRKLKKNYITAEPFNSYNGTVFSLDLDSDYYMSGLWQNYKYFERYGEELRENIRFRKALSNEAQHYVEELKCANSVVVHVRRGDFTNPIYNESHNICGRKYYDDAMKLIRTMVDNPVYYVFSDDIEYCRTMFTGIDNIIFVSESNIFRVDEELQLMSICKNIIISNSTFSYWAGWLGEKHKNVICPTYAEKRKMQWCELEAPKEWKRVDNI